MGTRRCGTQQLLTSSSNLSFQHRMLQNQSPIAQLWSWYHQTCGSRWMGATSASSWRLVLTSLISYEFATNEFINDMCSVPLETASTESGTKDFIIVGTTIDRGEDLATKGAVSSKICFSVHHIHVSDRLTFSRSLKLFQTQISPLSDGTSFVSAAEMKPKGQ